MSKTGSLRKAMGYDASTPRCSTCTNAKKPYVYLTTNSRPAFSPWQCNKGGFFIKPQACCDHWTGAKGERLEP